MSKTGSVRSDHTLPDLLTPDEVAAWLRTTDKAVYAKAMPRSFGRNLAG